MTHRLSHHLSVPLLALAGALATLLVSLALFAPSSAPLGPSAADASPFCGGEVRSNYNFCYGAARDLRGVSGYGEQHSVCVGAGAISGACSGGPNQIATINYGTTYHMGPYIQVNAAGATTLWGNTFL